jgi:hypothetical protein
MMVAGTSLQSGRMRFRPRWEGPDGACSRAPRPFLNQGGANFLDMSEALPPVRIDASIYRDMRERSSTRKGRDSTPS